ncbi:hypothetical protein WJX81_004442 [Elliptochloris bilobata]|uniref:MMS19 nucleotide excision repair protein n=1 Tax=Elliptochloris bilobata TaxID=381761 RepID=A0AAW1RPS1_9CHLO
MPRAEPTDGAAAGHAVDVLRRWGKRLGSARSAELAPEAAAAVLGALWGAPADAVTVKALAALGSFFAAHPRPLLEGVRQRLAEQPRAPSGSSQAPAGASAQPAGLPAGGVGELFERLAPLIALRALPAAAMEASEAACSLYGGSEAAAAPNAGAAEIAAGRSTGAALAELAGPCGGASASDAAAAGAPAPGSIAAALLQRMAGARELPEVRRQAAELVGHLASPAAECAVADMIVRGAAGGDTLALRAGLFSMCSALGARGARALVLRDGGGLRRVTGAIAAALRWPQGMHTAHADNEDVHKAQLGCVDCLALLVSVQLESAHVPAAAAAEPAQPKSRSAALYPGLVIEEANGHEQPGHGGSPAQPLSGSVLLLDELVDALSRRRQPAWLGAGEAPPAARICLANALILAVRRAAPPAHALLAGRLVAPLLAALAAQCEPSTHVRAALFQVLFVAAHAVKDAAAGTAPGLLTASVAALQDAARSSAERMAAVRLLAALASSGSEAVLQRLVPDLLRAASAVQGVW